MLIRFFKKNIVYILVLSIVGSAFYIVPDIIFVKSSYGELSSQDIGIPVPAI